MPRSPLPDDGSDLARAVRDLQRAVRELAAAPRSANTSLTSGRFTVVGPEGERVILTPISPLGITLPDASVIYPAAIALSSADDDDAEGALLTYRKPTTLGSVPVATLISPQAGPTVATVLLQGGEDGGETALAQLTAGGAVLTLTPTGCTLVTAGGTSITINASGAYFTTETWTAPTLSNGWTPWGTPHATPVFHKAIDGTVQMQGLIKPGTTTAGTTVATLPVGYRPADTHVVRSSAGAAGASADLYIANTGAISINNAAGTVQWLSFANVRFAL